MRNINQSSINAASAETKTISARLRIRRSVPSFIEDSSIFGRNLLNDDNAVQLSGEYCYDAKMLSYRSGSNDVYVLFRVLKGNDNNLYYWVASSNGTGTNGWVNSGINIQNTLRLAIDPKTSAVPILRGDGIMKRLALRQNGSWELYYLQDFPVFDYASYGFSVNMGTRFAITGSPGCRQIALRMKEDGSYLVDAVHDDQYGAVLSANYFSATTTNGSVAKSFSQHLMAAAYVKRNDLSPAPAEDYKYSWTPSGIIQEQRDEASPCFDYLFLPNEGSGNILAITIGPGRVGSWQPVFASDSLSDDFDIIPIDACTYLDNNIMLMFHCQSPHFSINGASDPGRFVAMAVARDISLSPPIFSLSGAYLVTEKTVSSNENYYPYCLRFVPDRLAEKLRVIGFRQHLSADFPEVFGIENFINIPQVQAISINSSKGAPVSANVTLEKRALDDVLANYELDPRACEYEIQAGYSGDYNPIGRFELTQYYATRSEDGERATLSLTSSGVGKLFGLQSPGSVEFLSPSVYIGGGTGLEQWFKDFTIANGEVQISSSKLVSKNSIGEYKNSEHIFHRAAVVLANSPPTDRGTLYANFEFSPVARTVGLICRHTYTKNKGHRCLLFLIERLSMNYAVHVYLVNTDDQERGAVLLDTHTISVSEMNAKFYLINPHPGKYVLISVSGDPQTVITKTIYVPDRYDSNYYLDPKGHYGLVIYSNEYPVTEWVKIVDIVRDPNPNSNQTVFEKYTDRFGQELGIPIPIAGWNNQFLNYVNHKLGVAYQNSSVFAEMDVKEIVPLPDNNVEYVIDGPLAFSMKPLNLGIQLGERLYESFFYYHDRPFKNAFYVYRCTGPMLTYMPMINKPFVYHTIDITSTPLYLKETDEVKYYVHEQEKMWYRLFPDAVNHHLSLVTPSFANWSNQQANSTAVLMPTIYIGRLSYIGGDQNATQLVLQNSSTPVSLYYKKINTAYSSSAAISAWFVTGDYTYSIDDVIRLAAGCAASPRIKTEISLSNTVSSHVQDFPYSTVVDGYQGGSNFRLSLDMNDREEFLEHEYGYIKCPTLSFPVVISDRTNMVQHLRIAGNQELFAFYINGELIFSYPRLDTDYSYQITARANTCYIHIPFLSDLMESFFVDAGSGAMQSISEYLSERHIGFVDLQDGSIKFYRGYNTTYNLGRPMNKYSLLNKAYSTSPPTHIRIVSDEFYDYLDTEASKNFGYRFHVVNANTLIGARPSRTFGINKMREAIAKTTTISLSGPIDWRIQPDDVIGFQDDNNVYGVLGVTFELSQSKEEAGGRMTLTLSRKVDYV